MYGWIITLFQQYLQLRFPSSSSVSWLRYCEVLSLSSFTSIHRHDDLPDSHTLSLLCHILDDLQRHHHILPAEILEEIGALYLQTLIHEGYDNLLRCLGSSFDEWFTNINKIHQHLESIYPNISPPEFWCVSIQHSEVSRSSTIEHNEYVLYYSSHRPDATEIFLPMIRGIVREVAKEYFSTSILAMKLLTTQGIDDSPHSSWSIITMPLNEEPRISSRKYNSPMTPSTAGRCPFQQPDLGDEVRRFSDNSIRSSYHLLQSTTPHFFNHSSHSEAFSLPSPQRSPKESNRQIQQPTQDHVISSSQINGRLGLGESDRSLVTEGEELQRAEDTPHQRERPQLDDLMVLVETEEDNADASRSNDSLPKPEPRHQAPILSRFYRLFQRSSSRLVPVTPRSAGCPPNWTPAVMQPQLKPSIASSLFESIYSFSRSRSQVSALPPPLSAVETLFLSLGIAVEQAVRLYPFHILFDIQSLSILSSGLAVSEYLNMQENLCLDELFTLKQPKKFTWIMLQRSLELSAQEAMVASARTLPSPVLRTSIVITVISKEPSKRCPKDHKPHGFQLTGQVICSQSATSSTSVALFLANPHVTSVSDMLSQGLSLFDLEEYPLAQSLVIQSEVMRLETMVSLQKEKAAEVQVEASQSLANEMKTVASKAEEALDVKKIFVRTVSHEIRTPLTVAKMGLSLLERDFTSYVSSVTSPVPSALASLPQLDSSSATTATVPTASAPTVPLIRECIEEIQLSLETAINILNDLLAYEKLESGILVTFKTLRPLRLSEQQSQQRRVPCCLMDSIRPFRLQAQEKEIELLVEDRHEECFNDSGGVLCVEDMLVHVDENKMSQVIRNLLSNAIKFTPPKGTVTVRFQYSTDTVATLPKLSPTVPLTTAHESPVGKNEKAVGEGVGDEIEGKVVEVNGERMEVQRRGTLTVEFIDSGAGISPVSPSLLVVISLLILLVSGEPKKAVPRDHSVLPRQAPRWRRFWTWAME
jgi:signal transduction histidine kinase